MKVTEKKLLDLFEQYKQQLLDNPSISPTKYKAMETAIYGCKCIVNDCFGSPRARQNSKSK